MEETEGCLTHGGKAHNTGGHSHSERSRNRVETFVSFSGKLGGGRTATGNHCGQELLNYPAVNLQKRTEKNNTQVQAGRN